jgi:AraC-like DNA-binding protein
MQKNLLNGGHMEPVVSRGYLHEDFRLFHSTDRRDMDFQTHSHDFHKIVLCLSGQVTYVMEGSTYYLRPWDMLLIPEHQIHQSNMRSSAEPYERIILWINDGFLRGFGEEALLDVFRWPYRQHCGLFRPDVQSRRVLIEKLLEVEHCQGADTPGHGLLATTYLLQFLLELRCLLQMERTAPEAEAVRSDPRFNEMLEYINGNLGEDLSIDALARRFYISPSHLMHAFKRHTGCTVHQYVRQKRLILASERIRGGDSVADAAVQAGFLDYTTFLKAFRRQYGCAPSALRG